MGDRHRFRALWHDYNEGLYFVTVCAYEKRHLYGKIAGTRFFASELGEIIEKHLKNIPQFHQDVEILNYVVMPNHIHMVLSVGTARRGELTSMESRKSMSANMGCLRPPKQGEMCPESHHNSRLASIIGAFKAGVTRTARTRRIASLPCWQSRYHEHIIRNQRAFDYIMKYIDTNVENWSKDCFVN